MMDKYAADACGINMDIVSLIQALDQLLPQIICRQGDDHFVDRGNVKKKLSPGPFKDSSIHFLSKWTSLIELLDYLDTKKDVLCAAKVEDVVIWALLKREDQINGELSVAEIKKMGCIGASYCWSVI